MGQQRVGHDQVTEQQQQTFVSQKNISSYANHDLQPVDKTYICKQRWNISLFSQYLIPLEFGFSSWFTCGIDGLLQPDYNYLN